MTEKGSYGLPGVKSERTATPRRILKTRDGAIIFPGGRVIDGSKSRDPLNTGDIDVLRAGLVMGKISTSGKYAPSFVGKLAAAAAASATSLTVSLATGVELIRRLGGTTGIIVLIGPEQVLGGTVTVEVVTVTNIVTTTVTCSAITAAFINGSLIGINDNSYQPLGFLGDGYGIKVTDSDENDIDVPFPNLVVGGVIDESQIINLPADPEGAEWLRGEMNKAGQFIFDELFTGTTVLETPTPTPTPSPTPTPTPT